MKSCYNVLVLSLVMTTFSGSLGSSKETIDVWPQLAPGETTRELGQAQPMRPEESPPITRLENVTRPTLDVFRAAYPCGTGVVILPGGGFGKIVPDKEGSEAAVWLNKLGITAFVLNYRTQNSPEQIGWHRALQDTQRALKLIRARSAEWNIQSNQIGLLGFSAGGQVAARLLSDKAELAYEAIDAVDETVHRPDFALLIYPWNLYDSQRDGLIDGVFVAENCPPTFLVHTHDDRSSSLGAVYFYAGLKKRGIPAELHVYGNGGHGYGLRAVPGSQISSWTDHAAHWIGANDFY